MQTRTYSVTHCPNCNKQISLESPPSNKRYEKAEIHIDSGTVLLPKRVVDANHRDGYSDSHATGLEGYYCNPECLAAYIRGKLDTRGAEEKAA